jgi:hypothetical protein
MNHRTLVVCLGLLAVSPAVSGQQPRVFPEYRGTWTLDESAGAGRIAGLPVARTLVIMTTPTEITVAKDSGLPEVYRFDGTESKSRDPRTGVPLEHRYSFLLVADMLALTSRLTRQETGRPALTEILTDAYRALGDTLTVQRQLSQLVEPPGSLATFAVSTNYRQTLVYRRRSDVIP